MEKRKKKRTFDSDEVMIKSAKIWLRPFMSKKYDVTKHPKYHLTADFSAKNYFDIEKFIQRGDNLILKPDDEYIVIDGNEVQDALADQ